MDFARKSILVNVFHVTKNNIEDLIVKILVFIFKPFMQIVLNRYKSLLNFKSKKSSFLSKRNIYKISVGIIIIISGVIIAFSANRFEQRALAHTDDILHKYYTSVIIEPGDTLWSIADEYYELGYDNHIDYIEEVLHINHLSASDYLISGEYIVIPYYSYEVK